jgi:sugar lactone lactonase YvrE
MVRIRAITIPLCIAAIACAANPPAAKTAPSAGGADDSASAATAPVATPAPAATPAAAATPPSSATPAVSGKPAVLAKFDAAAGELPEGLATKDTTAYVGFAPLGEIAKVDLPTGKSTRFAKLPKPVPGKGFMTGLAFGADGMLYAALVSFDPSVQPGIYRVAPAGGQATLFAKDAGMVFPNGLVFDARGTLFVTDSAAGAVYRVSPSGAAAVWASSPLLTGDAKACGGSGNPFPIGANGIVEQRKAFYVTNTDKGLVVRLAIKADGSAAAPEIVAGPDCPALAGADGLVVDADDNLVVAVNRQNKVVRLARGGAIEVIAENGAIDFPASVTRDANTVIATNFALANASTGKTANPALLRIAEPR